jgi:hypothetical protein
VRELVRRPIVRFVVAGALLYWAFGERPVPPTPPAIVVSAAQVRALRDEFARDHGRPPTAEDEAALVNRLVDDEVLYRAALAFGLDRDDRSIRWRLSEAMHFLEPDGPEAAPLDVQVARAERAVALGLDRDDSVLRRMLVTKIRLLAKGAAERDGEDEVALRDYWARHRERWTRPATVSFRHVFLSRTARGARLDADAARALDALRRDGTADGDPFFGPRVVEARSAEQLAGTFGDAFARAVMALPAGTWSGPVASAWGLHLVRVDARAAEATAPFDAVRTPVRLGLVAERHEVRVRELVAALRARWPVHVESAGS